MGDNSLPIQSNKHVILVQKIKKLSSRLDEDGPEDKEKQKLDFCALRVSRGPQETLSRYATGLRIQFFEFNMGKRLGRGIFDFWTTRDDLGGDQRLEKEIGVDLDHQEALDE
ncbi:hypothetical protein E3N88_14305 [Mikania micrantha]|uniref:Uncharacterized protein n=1 Tax=Mikania micrantha TaxID=192012 RepID=A0A5N6P456_9ASTR|nr:hypothetical protein E3N88_14305 [Mikania micrantha]